MLIIPAIDLRRGRVVRLFQGDYKRQTTYGRDPVLTARWFLEQGARRVHVVDLDAARGRPNELSAMAMGAVVDALAHLGVDTQVGGGMRSEASARHWLERGAGHVIAGSVALRSPETARAMCTMHPGRILLGLDVRGGEARGQGWTEAAGLAEAHVRRWRDWPAAGIIHTDTERDGTMSGPDVDAIGQLMAAYAGPVYAGGGVSSIEDIAACHAAGVAGVIVGRALYEGTVNLRDAVSRYGAVAQ